MLKRRLKWQLFVSPCPSHLFFEIKSLFCTVLFHYSAYEVPAATAEVLGVSGRWQSPGGSAGAPRRADPSQVQHRSHPRSQRVLLQV